MFLNYEESFSACATCCSWLHRWLSYCLLQIQALLCFLLFCIKGIFSRASWLSSSVLFLLRFSMLWLLPHTVCETGFFLLLCWGWGFVCLFWSFTLKTLLFVMHTSRKFLLLPDESFFKDFFGCGVFVWLFCVAAFGFLAQKWSYFIPFKGLVNTQFPHLDI